jgi:hypothetical protein
MIALDEDALICDLAETYQIYDYRSLPLKTVATLAAGLRENSRIKLLASGSPVNQDTLLLATIADRVELFRFGFSKDADKKEPPPSLLRMLLGEEKPVKNNSGARTFRSADELNKELARLRGD